MRLSLHHALSESSDLMGVILWEQFADGADFLYDIQLDQLIACAEKYRLKVKSWRDRNQHQRRSDI